MTLQDKKDLEQIITKIVRREIKELIDLKMMEYRASLLPEADEEDIKEFNKVLNNPDGMEIVETHYIKI